MWSAAITIDVTDDPSLIREMALAGCMGVFIGFESFSDDNLVQRPQEDSKDSRLWIAAFVSSTITPSKTRALFGIF